MTTPTEILLRIPEEERRRYLLRLTDDEFYSLQMELQGGTATSWARWRNDPVGFVTEVLREDVWSKQVEILESVARNKRTAVPACHAPGKSHIAARAIA